MFVIKEMRINKFEIRPIVSARQMFLSQGERPATVTSKDTADCFDVPTLVGASKNKVLGLAEEKAKAAVAYKEKNGNVKQLDTPAASL